MKFFDVDVYSDGRAEVNDGHNMEVSADAESATFEIGDSKIIEITPRGAAKLITLLTVTAESATAPEAEWEE